MEVSIGDFGRMMFEMMQDKYKDMPKHWASIAKEAKPLVQQLLDLNEKMVGEDGKPGGYSIIGAVDKKTGKKKMSDSERITKAQRDVLLAEARTLKVGDHFWLVDHSDHEMYIGQNEPLKADDITKKGIYYEMQHLGGYHTERLSPDDKVLKAPAWYGDMLKQSNKYNTGKLTKDKWETFCKDYDAKQEEFESDEYWLKEAERLGY